MRCPSCEAKTAAPPMAADPAAGGGDIDSRVAALEEVVAALQEQLAGVQMAALAAPLPIPSLV